MQEKVNQTVKIRGKRAEKGRQKGYTFIDKWTRSEQRTRVDAALMAEVNHRIQSICLVRLL